MLKQSAAKYRQTRPDLSKLVRSVEDSLTGIVYHDDSQIVEVSAKKIWGQQSCVDIEVVGLADGDLGHDKEA